MAYSTIGVMPRRNGQDIVAWYQNNWGGNNDVMPPEGLSWPSWMSIPEAGDDIHESFDVFFLGVFAFELGVHIDFDVDRIDVGEFFEQDGFPFHNRLGGQSADIAEAENGCAFGDNGDEITFGCVVIGR